MSAARRKPVRFPPKKPIQALSRTASPAPANTAHRTPAGTRAPPNGSSNGATDRRPVPRQVGQAATPDKGKQRAAHPPSSQPISISGDSEQEEDDFEEVEIPSAGPSSPYPFGTTTPVTNGTRSARATTVATLSGEDAEEDADDNDSSENPESDGEEGDGDGVIRVEIGGETPEEKAKRLLLASRKKPMTSKDRAIRVEAHKLHVLALLASARIRNRWCCNALLQARLLSLLPHPLQAAFNIPPSRFPDRAQRSRLFFDALQSLVTWWSQSFFDISDPAIGLRTRTWDEVQEIVEQLPRLSKLDFIAPLLTVKGQSNDDDDSSALENLEQSAGGEKLRTVNSLMKKALQQEGSRDVSAQLFVALTRACGLGSRLVYSLQAVPWRAEKGTPRKKPPGSGRKTVASRQGNGVTDEDEDEDEFEEVPIPEGTEVDGSPGMVYGKVKGKPTRAAGRRRLQDPADLYRLRKQRPAPAQTPPSKPKKKPKTDLSQQPPVFWAEVFSRSDQRWIPVDPVNGIIRKKAHYEPASDAGPIRMVYVIAFEEDGFARDVTLRYTKNFGAKTSKLRVQGRKDEPEWWSGVIRFLERPYRLKRDELEDAELETSHFSEGMPLHMNGFKDHPIYVLERHLKRDEVIQPKREIGRFKGEPVYRRAHVQACKTAENWMRMGRRVKDRQEPLKWVKQRAVTIQKRRAQELAKQEGGEDIQQGLYAEWQTELYRPPPIKDGVIPTNAFGNIDLYAPTMLPVGAVHLPYKGIAKVAKQLGISFAEACTGFEFKNQRAIPTITGIVVAKENEALTMEAYWESAAAAEEREKARREDKALKRWKKLINGLRIRKRLQAEYGQGDQLHETQYNPMADPAADPSGRKGKITAADVIGLATKESSRAWADRNRSVTPCAVDGEPVALEVEPSAATADPISGDALKTVIDIQEEEEEEEMAEVEVPDITPVIRYRTPSPDVDLIEVPAPKTVELLVSEDDLPIVPMSAEAHIDGSAEIEEDLPEVKPKGAKGAGRKTRQTSKKKVAHPPPAPTRSLRSRGAKSKDQQQAERAKRARIRAALGSDDGDEDED